MSYQLTRGNLTTPYADCPACVFGNHEQHAPILILKDGQQAPCTVQVKPADSGKRFSC
jgi:hypothetical protein